MTLFFVASHRLSLLATSRSTSGSYGCVGAPNANAHAASTAAHRNATGTAVAVDAAVRADASQCASHSTRTLRASARAVHPSVTVITRSYRPGASGVKLVTSPTEASRSKPSDAAPAPVGDPSAKTSSRPSASFSSTLVSASLAAVALAPDPPLASSSSRSAAAAAAAAAAPPPRFHSVAIASPSVSLAVDTIVRFARHIPTSSTTTSKLGCGAALHANVAANRTVDFAHALETSRRNPYVPTTSGANDARTFRSFVTVGAASPSGAVACKYACPLASASAGTSASPSSRKNRRHAFEPCGASVSVHSYSSPSPS